MAREDGSGDSSEEGAGEIDYSQYQLVPYKETPVVVRRVRGASKGSSMECFTTKGVEEENDDSDFEIIGVKRPQKECKSIRQKGVMSGRARTRLQKSKEDLGSAQRSMPKREESVGHGRRGMRKAHAETDVSEMRSDKRKRKEKRSVSRKPKQKPKLDQDYVSADSEEESSGMSERKKKKSVPRNPKQKPKSDKDYVSADSEEESSGMSERKKKKSVPRNPKQKPKSDKDYVSADSEEESSGMSERKKKKSVPRNPKQKTKSDKDYVSADSEEQSSGMSESLVKEGRPKHKKGKATGGRESEAVESEEDGGKTDRFNTHCSPRQMTKVFETILASEKHVRVVEDMGFGGILRLQCRWVCKDLINWMVERFNPVSMSIDLGSSKIELVDDDVRLVLGLPNGNIPFGPKTYSDVREAFAAKWPECNTKNKDGPYVFAIDKAIEEDKDAGEEFKRNFIVCLVSRLLAPASRAHCNWKFLRFIRNLEEVPKMNFCAFTLAELGYEMYKWKQETRPQMLNGCLLFLQMLYLDRVVPFYRRMIPREVPRIIGWTHDAVLRRLLQERRKIGGFGHGRLAPPKDTDEANKVAEYLGQKGDKKAVDMPDSSGSWESEMNLLISYGKETSEAYKRFRSQVKRVSSQFPQMEKELHPFLKPIEEGNVSSSQFSQFTDESLEMIHQITQACCQLLYGSAGMKQAEGQEGMKGKESADIAVDKEQHDARDFDLDQGFKVTPVVGVEDVGDEDALGNATVKLQTMRPHRKKLKAACLRSPFMQGMGKDGAKYQIPNEDAILVDYGMRAELDKSELLYDDGHNHVVSRECFLTLGDKSEIDITIMDAWCLALNAKEGEQSVPRRLFLSAHIWLVIGGYHVGVELSNEEEGENKSTVARLSETINGWLLANKVPSITPYELVFLPILQHGHYYVVCIDFKDEIIHVINNLKKDFRLYGELEGQTTILLMEYLHSIKHPKCSVFKNFEWGHMTPKWKKRMKGKAYLSNNKDCGVFAMKHMELFEGEEFDSDLGPDMTSRYYRRSIAAEIIKDETNRIRVEVMRKAKLAAEESP